MLTRWDAVSTLDRMFDDVMGSMLGTATSTRTFDPSIDVHASDDEIVFVCDVPGIKQDDLEVTLENHVLTIKGTRRFDGKENEQVMLGRAYGSFNRRSLSTCLRQLVGEFTEQRVRSESGSRAC
jgi:HSP20 family molecular chaperone IbpA